MTGTNQASELYELCKKVYELTKWEDDEIWAASWAAIHYEQYKSENLVNPRTPLYTSDYLLEKLPPFIRRKTGDMEHGIKFAFKLRMSTKNSGKWRAGYYNSPSKQQFRGLNVQTDADTPLKALLKLTIALHDSGATQ